MDLFAAVPTHNGTLAAESVETLLAAQQIALGRGWGFSFKYLGGATISVTRNALRQQHGPRWPVRFEGNYLDYLKAQSD